MGGISFSHDARGNLTHDGSRTLGYDLENRLLTVSGPTSLNLSYGPAGRLRQSVAGSATTQFLYSGSALVAEYDGAGNVLRRYVHGPGVDEPIVRYEGAAFADPRYLIADRQGSIIATRGASTVRHKYGPYGEPDAWAGSRFRYTGQIALPEAGLYHYKARVYDPALGRFLQTDPVGYDDDVNLYAYVRNDSLNAADPTGREIRLQAHPVFGIANHAKVTIIPNNQAKYQNDSRFQRLPDGRVYATLGAGPIRNTLVSATNRERDLIQGHNVSDELLTLPAGVDEDTMIERLFSADAAYPDDLDYAFYPSRRAHSEGYNSNSYVSGLLRAVGFRRFAAPPNTPGWEQPIAPNNFRRGTVEITDCSTEQDECGS